ncbi:hypothetical protein PR202_gb08065 [Eleusine coracana subsp. coracana]|uniref:Protein kinase domain-containing protein n=1 Tax=Eleusine coracana subsp. coracana TaxID=191504 RepID=A0AAV5EC30_ELECO|nr:hypothetical protein PR202_gb08065 [Eleusine coracana subsp. coracana]
MLKQCFFFLLEQHRRDILNSSCRELADHFQTNLDDENCADAPTEKKAPHKLLQFTFSRVENLLQLTLGQIVFLGKVGLVTSSRGGLSQTAQHLQPGTGVTVAVKSLKQDALQGHREWVAEVDFLGQLHHKHLVKLIGYCIEDDQRLLVYEFMPRGSLENHLFRKGALPLPWPNRMKIALGAAKGLTFLHGGPKPVIYRDFKNIKYSS